MNKRLLTICAAALPLAALSLSACVNQQEKNKIAVQKFLQTSSGVWISDSGAELFMAPVRARMVTDEAMYVERRDAKGLFARLVNVETSKDGKRLIQRALTFTQEGQWRNLREQPELFTALLPKDVAPAGTCDIKVSDDANSVSYSCGGSAPEAFRRKP